MLLLFLLLLLAAASPTPSVLADVPPSNKVVFILAGQSNMAGRGGVVANRWDGRVPADCAPSPAVLRLTPDLRWEQAREPLHQGIDAANHAVGVGPGMPFANALLRSGRAGAPVLGLVPCAVGGTRMADWARGTDLYAQMLRRARVAVETGGRIGALLWYQGESDTLRWSDANEYGRRMGMLVRDIRADLGIPHLLVIQVGLASGLGQYTQVVREAQKGIKLRNVRFVDAMGLPLQDGHLHLSTQAQVQLGHMLAQSYLNYYGAQC
ncbi:probable carbohydrate esterase At4g34215 isoform X3 [Panicum virgatum]|uniref:probable carbohydrate esterase At4g34215 isoform X3 n=1 Tax=Panicum virgatum TaxID=38727 RepID=UPI0019D58833|nr:probable carbohydrate esterase At4g34215 isoform X3 [Panicum virgatum]